MGGYRRQEKVEMLWKHAVDKHDGSRECFEYFWEGQHNEDWRKTDEALRISRHKGVILNSKSEFRQPYLPRCEIQLGRKTQ